MSLLAIAWLAPAGPAAHCRGCSRVGVAPAQVREGVGRAFG